jgi:hypothetical protein
MQASITPVSVFPGTASVLFVSPSISITVGGLPSLHYYLRDNAGNNLKDGDVSLTQEQWDGWDDSVSDESYLVAAVAANLGLTIAA